MPLKASKYPSDDDAERLVKQFGLFMSYPQAAAHLSLSERTLKRLTAAGDLPCYKPRGARTLRVRTQDVAMLMERVA